MTEPGKTHLPQLDGVRGIAVLAVVCSHWIHASKLSPIAVFAGRIVATLAFAMLSWWLLERPAIALKRHVPYERA